MLLIQQAEFLNRNLSVKMKGLGYHTPSFGFYNEESISEDVLSMGGKQENFNDLVYVKKWRNTPNDDVSSAPLFQQAVDFFQENFKLEAWVNSRSGVGNNWQYSIQDGCDLDYHIVVDEFDSKLSAREACIEKLIELVYQNYSNLSEGDVELVPAVGDDRGVTLMNTMSGNIYSNLSEDFKIGGVLKPKHIQIRTNGKLVASSDASLNFPKPVYSFVRNYETHNNDKNPIKKVFYKINKYNDIIIFPQR